MIPRRVYEHAKAHNWFAVAIDFIIVVAAILIALEIANLNETRQDRMRERQYLARIAAELDESIASIKRGVELTKERAAFGELLIRSEQTGVIPEIAEGDALAAYARMLERPDFIEWLPTVAERGDNIRDYSAWLASAEDLRARIRLALAGPAPSGDEAAPWSCAASQSMGRPA
jgi:hypothetical protein